MHIFIHLTLSYYYVCLNEASYLLKNYLWKGKRVIWNILKLQFYLSVLKPFIQSFILSSLGWYFHQIQCSGLGESHSKGLHITNFMVSSFNDNYLHSPILSCYPIHRLLAKSQVKGNTNSMYSENWNKRPQQAFLQKRYRNDH